MPTPLAMLLQHARVWLLLQVGAGGGLVGTADAATARERTLMMALNCMLMVVFVFGVGKGFV